MLRILRVTALVLAFSSTATAGEIQYGATNKLLPPDELKAMAGLAKTGEPQDSCADNAMTDNAIADAQVLINLLSCLLPLI